MQSPRGCAFTLIDLPEVIDIMPQNSLIILVAAIFVLAAGTPVVGRAQDANALKKHFLNEAPPAWGAYREVLSRLQGKFSYKSVYKGKVNYYATSVIKQNNNCKLLLRQFEALDDTPDSSAATKGFVLAFNSNYDFRLRRKTKDISWAIADLDIDKRAKSPDSLMEEVNSATKSIQALIRIGATDLTDLIQQSSFRIIHAKKVDYLGREAVSVEFDNKHATNSPGPFIPIQSGTMILDPERSWCLRSCNIITKYGNGDGKSHFEYKFRDSKSKHPIPVEIIETSEIKDTETGELKPGSSEMKFELAEVSQLPDDREFTMTAFRLLEPMGAPPVASGTRWHIWLSLAAAGSLCLALLCVAIRRRYFSPQAPNK